MVACWPLTRATHLTPLLKRCKSLRELKQIHAQIATSGLYCDPFAISELLLFAAVSSSGDIHYSYRLFRTNSNPSLFVWNAVIRGYSKSKTPNRALTLFVEMLRSGTTPDHLTFPFLAKSCARLSSLPLGRSIHCHAAKNGLDLDLFVQNSLIHMYAACSDILSARKVFDGIVTPNMVSWNTLVDGYAKCGDMHAARDLFSLMPEQDVVSWSALIDGYVKGGDYREALSLFQRMRVDGPEANTVTMVSVLCACAHLGALDQGREMHRYIRDSKLGLSLQLSTSLVDMYSKCGSINEALEVFHATPTGKTDVLIWNAVIGGLAMHGLSKESIEMFKEMRKLGFIPDEITYLELLSACAHGGLVDEARSIFTSLQAEGMTLQIEHYACMVDVLGRSGHVEEAYEIVRNMPMEPSASLLGALLSACLTHGWVKLGEIVGSMLVELEPDHDGRYVGLSNVYAVARRWEDAKVMRETMEKRGVKKAPGNSALEVDGSLHRFIAHDKTHPHSTEIYLILNVLAKQMKAEPGSDSEDLLPQNTGEDG